MASNALAMWQNDCTKELNEIVAAHAAIGGSGPGRRVATLQVNHAYAMLLASQFQRYCRDLHSEAVDHVCLHVRDVGPLWIENLVRERLTSNRKLDRGNANPGNIGSDFGRLGMAFWDDVRGHDHRNQDRQARLEVLNGWRNAIAHQDFHDAPRLDAAGRRSLRKADVTAWRNACDQLAVSFDLIVGSFVQGLIGATPW